MFMFKINDRNCQSKVLNPNKNDCILNDFDFQTVSISSLRDERYQRWNSVTLTWKWKRRLTEVKIFWNQAGLHDKFWDYVL